MSERVTGTDSREGAHVGGMRCAVTLLDSGLGDELVFLSGADTVEKSFGSPISPQQ